MTKVMNTYTVTQKCFLIYTCNDMLHMAFKICCLFSHIDLIVKKKKSVVEVKTSRVSEDMKYRIRIL